MSEWFWSLHGWDLLWATLGIIAAVLGGVFGAVVALVAALGKGISTTLGNHDFRNCSCFSCNERRTRAWEKRRTERMRSGSDGDIVPMGNPRTAPHFVSTTHLEIGDGVSINGRTYRVTELRTDRLGYLVAMRNLQTGRDVVVTVRFEAADLKVWEPLRRWGSSQSHNPGM